jgi:hypothetical protein
MPTWIVVKEKRGHAMPSTSENLRQHLVKHRDVVGGGVRVHLAVAQPRYQRLGRLPQWASVGS